MKIMDIDCRHVLIMALFPILALFVLEIIWNLVETVNGISLVLWVVKLGTLGAAGWLYVMGLPFLTDLVGGD